MGWMKEQTQKVQFRLPVLRRRPNWEESRPVLDRTATNRTGDFPDLLNNCATRACRLWRGLQVRGRCRLCEYCAHGVCERGFETIRVCDIWPYWSGVLISNEKRSVG